MKAVLWTVLIFLYAAALRADYVHANKAQILENYSNIPHAFTINEGQYNPQVKFTTHGSDCTMFFTKDCQAKIWPGRWGMELHHKRHNTQEKWASIFERGFHTFGYGGNR